MKVSEISAALGMKCLSEPAEDREVTGCYAGDLLSWVIGRAEKDNAWATIMSNVNVAAVAVMADISMIILTESVEPDDPLLEKARLHGIGMYSTESSTYEISWKIHEILK